MQSFLGRLSESEKTLKYGVFPEEEAAVQECQNQLQVSASPHLQAHLRSCSRMSHCLSHWGSGAPSTLRHGDLGPQAPHALPLPGCPAGWEQVPVSLGSAAGCGGWDPTVPHSVCPPRS